MPNQTIKFKKKAYNESTDSGAGIVVFDTSKHKVYVGGVCYSSDVADASYNGENRKLSITKRDGSSSSIDIPDILSSTIIRIYRNLTGTAGISSKPYNHAKWDVTDETITEYVDGMVVSLKVPVAGLSTYGVGFQINNLGYKPVVYNVNNTIGTRYGVGSVVWCQYNSTQTATLYQNSSSASTITGCWQVMDYDENTNTIGYQLRTNSSVRPTLTRTRYNRILFSNPDNTKWIPANTEYDNSATSQKTVNQNPINPFGRIVYCESTTNFAAEANVSATVTWDQYTLELGYSFNTTGAALTLTYPAPVYVKCAPQTDGSAIIDSTQPYVQALPSTNNGKIYIYLGQAYDDTHIELEVNHPVFYHDGGGIRVWTGSNPHNMTLGSLADTNISSLSNGQMLKYNSTSQKWENIDLISISSSTMCFGGLPSFSVTVTSNGHGSASANPSSVEMGSSSVLTATADSGYMFDKWSDNNTSNPRTLTDIQSDVSLSASFKPNTVTVTYTQEEMRNDGLHFNIGFPVIDDVEYTRDVVTLTVQPNTVLEIKLDVTEIEMGLYINSDLTMSPDNYSKEQTGYGSGGYGEYDTYEVTITEDCTLTRVRRN